MWFYILCLCVLLLFYQYLVIHTLEYVGLLHMEMMIDHKSESASQGSVRLQSEYENKEDSGSNTLHENIHKKPADIAKKSVAVETNEFLLPTNLTPKKIVLPIWYRTVLHVWCLSIYGIPIFVWKSPHDKGQPVLDEIHIVSKEHLDVYYHHHQAKDFFSDMIRLFPNCQNHANNNNNKNNTTIIEWNKDGWWNVIACHWSNVVHRDPVWIHDYWGRPMSSPNSHKSWRPLSILSFRYLRFPRFFLTDLDGHRWINILLHAAAAELVALLALQLLTPRKITTTTPTINNNKNIAPSDNNNNNTISREEGEDDYYYSLFLYTLTKLLFALHPTHVEVSANAANRPHLIAVVAICYLSDPNTFFPFFLLVLIIGFLSAETFLFGIVPAAVTLFILSFRQQQQQQPRPSSTYSLTKQTLAIFLLNSLRFFALLLGSFLYYGGRYQLHWLSIPTGLIRPAENPYFRLRGWSRIINYTYVTILHIAKAWDLDWIGFSHEYGHQCLIPLESFRGDVRIIVIVAVLWTILLAPFFWFVVLGNAVTVVVVVQPGVGSSESFHGTSPSATPTATIQPPDTKTLPMTPLPTKKIYTWSNPFLLWIFHLSWLVTLFPIMGIVKVGTFVADRIVVTSSVSVCILVANLVSSWLAFFFSQKQSHENKEKQTKSINRGKLFFLFRHLGGGGWWRIGLIVVLLAVAWRRIHLRTWDWMDPYTLLSSSLRTCPRLSKSHLEISKIYSGLYRDYFDLKKARWHLEQVESIDPTYCDVHYQFVHVALQETPQNLLEVEERLVQALICPFSPAGNTMEIWKRYWEVSLSPSFAGTRTLQLAQERYQIYQKQLQEAIERQEELQYSDDSEDETNHNYFVPAWKTK